MKRIISSFFKTSVWALIPLSVLPLISQAEVSESGVAKAERICGPDKSSQRRLPGIANSDCIALE